MSLLGAELPNQLWGHLFIRHSALGTVKPCQALALAGGGRAVANRPCPLIPQGLLCPRDAGRSPVKYQLFLCP